MWKNVDQIAFLLCLHSLVTCPDTQVSLHLTHKTLGSCPYLSLLLYCFPFSPSWHILNSGCDLSVLQAPWTLLSLKTIGCLWVWDTVSPPLHLAISCSCFRLPKGVLLPGFLSFINMNSHAIKHMNSHKMFSDNASFIHQLFPACILFLSQEYLSCFSTYIRKYKNETT